MARNRSEPERLLQALQGLLEIRGADLQTALIEACNHVARALRADKVDAFLYDPSRESLVAIGTSTQPLSALQKKVGLDVLPIANGGRVVWVYEQEKTFVTGRLDEDAEELRGVKTVLGIKSKVGVPIIVGGRKRGMMMIASLARDFFSDEDVLVAETIVGWVATVVHRAELVRQVADAAVEQGRRAVAEELVTVLAHDLRNLISPIAMRLQLIRRRRDEERGKDADDAAAALRTLDRLSRIISDLLDVARIDQGLFRMQLEPVDLVALVQEVAAALSRPTHKIHLDVSVDALVLADAERLEQCLENILSNAIQHSPPDAPVYVTIGTQVQDDGLMARLEIRDEGPGIAPESCRASSIALPPVEHRPASASVCISRIASPPRWRASSRSSRHRAAARSSS